MPVLPVPKETISAGLIDNRQLIRASNWYDHGKICLRTISELDAQNLTLGLNCITCDRWHVVDITSDDNVNVTDLLALLAAWGACP